jgi:hypothetical protein
MNTTSEIFSKHGLRHIEWVPPRGIAVAVDCRPLLWRPHSSAAAASSLFQGVAACPRCGREGGGGRAGEAGRLAGPRVEKRQEKREWEREGGMNEMTAILVPPEVVRLCPSHRLLFIPFAGGNTAASASPPGASAAATAGGNVERLRGGEAPQKLEAKIELECFNLLGEAPMWHETEVGVHDGSLFPTLVTFQPFPPFPSFYILSHLVPPFPIFSHLVPPFRPCFPPCRPPRRVVHRRVDAMGLWLTKVVGLPVVAGQALLA